MLAHGVTPWKKVGCRVLELEVPLPNEVARYLCAAWEPRVHQWVLRLLLGERPHQGHAPRALSQVPPRPLNWAHRYILSLHRETLLLLHLLVKLLLLLKLLVVLVLLLKLLLLELLVFLLLMLLLVWGVVLEVVCVTFVVG